MAYSFARRQELALERLHALGLDAGGRNPEKVWRELAAEQKVAGTTALAAIRSSYKGGGTYRPGRTLDEVRAAAKRKRPPKVQKVPQLDTTVTTTSSDREIKTALRNAAKAGHSVVVYVTACAAGAEPRTRIAPKKKDYKAPEQEGPPQVVGKVQIIAAPRGSEVFGRLDAPTLDPASTLEWMAEDGVQSVLCQLWGGDDASAVEGGGVDPDEEDF